LQKVHLVERSRGLNTAENDEEEQDEGTSNKDQGRNAHTTANSGSHCVLNDEKEVEKSATLDEA